VPLGGADQAAAGRPERAPAAGPGRRSPQGVQGDNGSGSRSRATAAGGPPPQGAPGPAGSRTRPSSARSRRRRAGASADQGDRWLGGFGGSGDYSGVFASLYSLQQDSQKAQQDADDADAADKWSNGLMSDDEWLAYIRTRIDAEGQSEAAGAVGHLRSASTASSSPTTRPSSRIRTAGRSTSSIAYYETAAGRPSRQELERVPRPPAHLNDLLDKRAGDDSIQDQARRSDHRRINKGTKTYGDLQQLLRAPPVKESRPNSDLKKSSRSRLKHVDETDPDEPSRGLLREAPVPVRRRQALGRQVVRQVEAPQDGPNQFKDNDPKRYYQILEAAVQLDKKGLRRA
jgi:hypothetical protein